MNFPDFETQSAGQTKSFQWINGQTSSLITFNYVLTPTKTGKYELACAQLCGFAHSLMRGDVYVQTQEEYDAWYKSRLATIPAAAKPANASEDF